MGFLHRCSIVCTRVSTLHMNWLVEPYRQRADACISDFIVFSGGTIVSFATIVVSELQLHHLHCISLLKKKTIKCDTTQFSNLYNYKYTLNLYSYNCLSFIFSFNNVLVNFLKCSARSRKSFNFYWMWISPHQFLYFYIFKYLTFLHLCMSI